MTSNLECWNHASDSWNDFIETGKDVWKFSIIAPGMMSLLPDWNTAGKHALDLCCGEGFYARKLDALGYAVTAVDFSENQVAHARAKGGNIDYLRGDASRLDGIPDRAFDLVVCGMGLQDVEDYLGAIAQAHRVLRPGGCLVFSITHPCFEVSKCGGWAEDSEGRRTFFKMDRYFEENTAVIDWNMLRLKLPFQTLYFHRPVSAYFNAVVEAGFAVERLLEPKGPEEDDLFDGARRIAYFLMMRCRKDKE